MTNLKKAAMTPEQWQRLRPILASALRLDADARLAYLDEVCADVSERSELESLLHVQKEAEKFLEEPPPVSPATNVTVSRHLVDGSLSELSTYVQDTGNVGSLDFRLPRGSGSAHSLEIRELLRQRLKIIVLVGLLTNAFMNAVRFARLQPLFTAAKIWHTWVPAGLNLLVLIGLTVVLWRKRIYNLGQLRWIEAVTFGSATLYFLVDSYFTNFEVSGGYLLRYVDRHPAEMILVSRTTTILWVMLIIGYGTFIPNTGRRCAVVVLAMASSPLVLIAVAGALHAEIPRRLLMLFLTDMVMWMGCAAAIAIYGSHKITMLRQEALAARTLGQYVLKRQLGQGGMGEVYLAEHTLLKRPCAVKVIRPDQSNNPTSLQRFLREVQVTATLTHPNTVQVFDYGQTDDGTVFYAMEYLPGFNLEKLVQECGPMSAPRVIHVLRQLCAALAEAHASGLIHRDIKPSNVILCRRGGLNDVAKLLDFGLARLQSSELAGTSFTQAGLIFGTPAYMSPEQASGKKDLDIRTDVYSLGALAWFLLTGAPPFVREGIVQTLNAHINEPVPCLCGLRPDVPEDLQGIVQRCLAKDPVQRFDDTVSLEKALARCRLAGSWSQAEAAAWWNEFDIPSSLKVTTV